jgi:Flp pilus assembly protein TadG|tara:strand:- start:35 stop:598 length:564 start_codon:yes stop_codon:yes gene_type:complete
MNMALQHGIIAPRLRAKLERWCQDRRGATAVEFAIVAAPFFFLIFGLMEVCMVFILSTVLEHALGEAARKIRTGQAQDNRFTIIEFRNEVCSNFYNMLECDERLYIDVRSLDNFSAADLTSPLDGDGEIDDSDFKYDPGAANDVVAVRVMYEWKLMTPWVSAPLSTLPNNRHLLQANAVFRNEPFGD